MKTCPQCGRSYHDAQLLCTACNLPLPKGEAADMAAVAHINFLLGELPQWVMAGWLDPVQARRLTAQYERRRDEMLLGGLRTPDWSAASAPPFPSGPLPARPPAPPPSPNLPPAPLAAFREDKSLAYWLAVGALMLLAGVLASVLWAWNASSGRPLVFALLLAMTVGLALLTQSRVVRGERITATVLTAIAALLIPVDLYVGNAFLLVGGRLTNEGMGLLTTAVCLPIYGWLAQRRGSRTFLVLASVDLSAGLHFLLQALLPFVLHTHAPLRLYGLYGAIYVPLAGLHLWASTRDSRSDRRLVWLGLMHVTAALALLSALVIGAQITFGPAAVALLLASVLYGTAAVRLTQARWATLGVTFLVAGAGLALAADRVPVGSHWYVYVLTALGIAWVVRRLSSWLTDETAQVYARAAFFVAALGAVAQAVRVVAALGRFPSFAFSAAELCGALACAALSVAFFGWTRALALRDALLAYGVLLLGLLAAHLTPHAGPGNVGLSLAVATGALWLLSRPQSALACGWLSLAICGAYVLHGGFLGTDSVALLLLIGLSVGLTHHLASPRSSAAQGPPAAGGFGGAGPVPQGFTPNPPAAGGPRAAEERGEAGRWVAGNWAGTAWLAVASATVLVLLWEGRLLPPLRSHGGLEPNNGYGLFLLTLGCLWLYARRREAAMRQAAGVLGIGNAALQMVYALNGGYLVSPLALLAAGVALTAGISWARRSERMAVWATTLLAYAYLTFVAALLVRSSALREMLLAVLMLAAALALAALAQQQRRLFLAYAAPLAGALGWAHAAHRLGMASEVGYSLALVPLVAGFCFAAVARARQGDDLWPAPLQNAALAVSTLALLPCLGDFLGTAPAPDVPVVTAALLLYGALFAAVAWLQRSPSYLYGSAALLNGAYLFSLLHHSPALTRALIALWLAAAGLVWVGLAAAWNRLTATFKASLFPVAAGVALVASGLALTDMHGDNALYALLLAGTVFAGIAWGTGRSGWVHPGIWTYLLAYGVWLWERIGTPGMTNSDYFLMPVGIYVLALGVLARRGLLDASAPPFFLAGLLLFLTPAYLAARQPYADLVHVLLLAAGSLAAIFYGLTSRTRVFLITGTLFLLLWIQLSLQGVTGQASWAVSAVLLGFAIIGSALYLEKRRDRRAQPAPPEWRE